MSDDILVFNTEDATKGRIQPQKIKVFYKNYQSSSSIKDFPY